ncbi:hypothetical protein D3C85_1613040 [compost metagenome]
MEVKAGRVLRDQTLKQRPAVDLLIGGDINQAREHHFIDLWRGGKRSGAGHHLFKNRLRGDFGALRDAQFLRPWKVARRFLSRRAREGLPALRNKQ